MFKTSIYENTRSGITDIYNSFMFKNAIFSKEDIPFCKSDETIPTRLISYTRAKQIHKEQLKNKNTDYHVDAFIHFYIDDQFFDSPTSGIWAKPMKTINILSHFTGIITPDFSIYQDFAKPQKQFNIYRMHGFGLFAQSYGLKVINNVRWGTNETWNYCFDGLYTNDIFSIGTVASNLRNPFYLNVFSNGFNHMLETLHPRILIIYGSDRYIFFEQAKNQGVQIIQFNSDTAEYYEGRCKNEQAK